MRDKEKAIKGALKFGSFATMPLIVSALLKGSELLTEQAKEVSANGSAKDLSKLIQKQEMTY